MSKEQIMKYSLIVLILLAIIVALNVILWPKAPDNSAGMGLTVDPYSGPLSSRRKLPPRKSLPAALPSPAGAASASKPGRSWWT